MKRFVALTLAAITLAGNAAAETPPSVWDRAKQPQIADEYQLHLSIQRVLHSQISDSDLGGFGALQMAQEAQKLRALSMLQQAGAATTQNALLRFDLASVYYELKRFPQAIETYRTARQDFPDHASSHSFQNLFDYAYACASVGDHDCETKLWRQIIVEFASEPERLPTPTLNLAEADMHRHALKESIAGYNETFRLSAMYRTGSDSPALAQWGLAVALDRSGEVEAASAAAAFAVSLAGQLGTNLLHRTGVSFFPDYEVNWYDGLSHAALAKRAQLPSERLSHWLLAERHMTAWVRGAEKRKDYWLPIAKARLDAYAKERKAAEALMLKVKPAPAEEEEPTSIVSPFSPFSPPARPIPRPKMTPPTPTPKTGDVHL